MSTEKEAPVALTTGTRCRVSDNGETVIHGRDGRCSITFIDAPEAPEPEPVDNRPHWFKTMRKGSGPRKTLRWKNNRKTAGFILPETLQGIEIWSWRALFAAAVKSSISCASESVR